MNTELKNAVKAADLKAQYDARVKRLVGHKRVLAQILIKTVDEFKGMNPCLLYTSPSPRDCS